MYEKRFEMSINNYYTMRNLLDFLCRQNYYKLIRINFSRQINMSIPQRINFVERLEEDDGATLLKNSKKTVLNFSLDSLMVTEQYK